MASLLTPFQSAFQPEAFALPSYPDYIFWIWTQTDTYTNLEAEDLKELRNEGWVELPESGDGTLGQTFFFSRTQLTSTLTIATQETTTFRLWAKSDDLRFAQQYPVQLTHAVQRPQLATDDPSLVTLPFELSAGSHALIPHPHDPTRLNMYRLDQLGNQGYALFEKIQHAFILSRQSSITIQQQPTKTKQRKKKGSGESDSTNAPTPAQIKTELWHSAQQAARELIILYWQLHQETMKHRERPTIPHVFNTDQPVALTPTPLAVQGVLAAYSNAQSGGEGWLHQQPAQTPTYLYHQEKNTAQIEWRPTTTNDVETLWKQIRLFSDLDGDVFLALLAQWMASSDEEGYTWISSEHILNYRGIQPRKYEDTEGQTHQYSYRREELETISKSIERIRDTHVTLQQWVKEELASGQPRRRGRPKKQALQLESYIMTIPEFIQQGELSPDTETGLPIAWRYRPGKCLEPFLSGPNRQTAYLLQRALGYDPMREFWEKRLARLVTFNLRMNVQGGYITRQLRSIFDELSLPQNRNDPDKTRQRFEKALNHLQADKLISQWGYQEALVKLPPKKWFDTWLDFHIQITVAPLSFLDASDEESSSNIPLLS